MALVPATLPAGSRVIGEAPDEWTEFCSFISDRRARWGFAIQKQEGPPNPEFMGTLYERKWGHYVVEGVPAPELRGTLDNMEFSRDATAYAYAFIEGGGVVVNGKVFDPGQSIAIQTLIFPPDDRHSVFIGCDMKKGEAKKGSFRVYLDGKVIGEGDICFGARSWNYSAPRFSSDSRRLYWFSLEGGELRFNVALAG